MAESQAAPKPATYIVEHLDPELGPWSELEYITVAKESHKSGNTFLLSSLPPTLDLPAALTSLPALKTETRGVEELYADRKDRVCLLDPAAAEDLSPEDGERFDVFLFGGILGAFLLLSLPLVCASARTRLARTSKQYANTPI